MYVLAKILLGQLIFGGIWGILYVSEYFQHDTEIDFYSIVTHNIVTHNPINPPALHKTSIHKVYS